MLDRLSYRHLVRPVTCLCLFLLLTTSFLADRPYLRPDTTRTPSTRIRSDMSGSLHDAAAPASALSNGEHPSHAAVAAEGDLAAFLQRNKRDFLSALQSQQRLSDWVIVMGEPICRL